MCVCVCGWVQLILIVTAFFLSCSVFVWEKNLSLSKYCMAKSFTIYSSLLTHLLVSTQIGSFVGALNIFCILLKVFLRNNLFRYYVTIYYQVFLNLSDLLALGKKNFCGTPKRKIRLKWYFYIFYKLIKDLAPHLRKNYKAQNGWETSTG